MSDQHDLEVPGWVMIPGLKEAHYYLYGKYDRDGRGGDLIACICDYFEANLLENRPTEVEDGYEQCKTCRDIITCAFNDWEVDRNG